MEIKQNKTYIMHEVWNLNVSEHFVLHVKKLVRLNGLICYCLNKYVSTNCLPLLVILKIHISLMYMYTGFNCFNYKKYFSSITGLIVDFMLWHNTEWFHCSPAIRVEQFVNFTWTTKSMVTVSYTTKQFLLSQMCLKT